MRLDSAIPHVSVQPTRRRRQRTFANGSASEDDPTQMSDRDRNREMTNAEFRLITDISMLIEARDPDGRIGKALEGFLGFDAKPDVREVLATGEIIEAEVHLGEAKVYIEIQRDEEGQDWIVRTEIEDVAFALDGEDRDYLTNSLWRELDSQHLVVLAGERADKGWHVVFEVEGQKKAILLSKSGIEPISFSDANFRALASQLVTQRALEIAKMIGHQVELEVFAQRGRRQPKNLVQIESQQGASVAFDPKRECQWVAEDVFAETSLAVTVDRLTGSVRVETLEPTFD